MAVDERKLSVLALLSVIALLGCLSWAEGRVIVIHLLSVGILPEKVNLWMFSHLKKRRKRSQMGGRELLRWFISPSGQTWKWKSILWVRHLPSCALVNPVCSKQMHSTQGFEKQCIHWRRLHALWTVQLSNSCWQLLQTGEKNVHWRARFVFLTLVWLSFWSRLIAFATYFHGEASMLGLAVIVEVGWRMSSWCGRFRAQRTAVMGGGTKAVWSQAWNRRKQKKT